MPIHPFHLYSTSLNSGVTSYRTSPKGNFYLQRFTICADTTMCSLRVQESLSRTGKKYWNNAELPERMTGLVCSSTSLRQERVKFIAWTSVITTIQIHYDHYNKLSLFLSFVILLLIEGFEHFWFCTPWSLHGKIYGYQILLLSI